MYIIVNTDGALNKYNDFRKCPLFMRFFCSFDDAAEVLRMLKVRFADDLNNARVEEFIYPYRCPSWYHPIFSCAPFSDDLDDFPEYDPSDPFGSFDPESFDDFPF